LEKKGLVSEIHLIQINAKVHLPEAKHGDVEIRQVTEAN
jgi:hypothetical protein